MLPPQTEPQHQGRNLDPALRPHGKSGQTRDRDVDREARIVGQVAVGPRKAAECDPDNRGTVRGGSGRGPETSSS